jgi:hypothetical protein
LFRSYQEYPAKSVGKQGKEFRDSSACKKLAGFFIRNLDKLVNLGVEDEQKEQAGIKSILIYLPRENRAVRVNGQFGRNYGTLVDGVAHGARTWSVS